MQSIKIVIGGQCRITLPSGARDSGGKGAWTVVWPAFLQGCTSRRMPGAGVKAAGGVQLLPDPASLLVFAISVDLGGGGRILSWLAC